MASNIAMAIAGWVKGARAPNFEESRCEGSAKNSRALLANFRCFPCVEQPTTRGECISHIADLRFH